MAFPVCSFLFSPKTCWYSMCRGISVIHIQSRVSLRNNNQLYRKTVRALFTDVSLTTYALIGRKQDSLLSSYISRSGSQNTCKNLSWFDQERLFSKSVKKKIHSRFLKSVVFSPHRKWCNSASSLKTMDSYDYRPIHLRNWWACKWSESATMNVAQQSMRYMLSGWINSNTGLSSMRGSIYLPSLLSRVGVPRNQLGDRQQPLQWPPTLSLPCSPSPTQGAQPIREMKCCSSPQQGWELLRVYTNSEGAWAGH